ncbi:hypothetical protein AK812_SmicGene47591, partial [Symbiodinium microadriaticum]
MDAVAGALAVPLTSLDPGPKDGVNRTLTYDSSVEDAQCPYFREKDITGADRHAPADPAPEEPARTIDPAPKGPADPAPKEVARTIDQAPRGPPADRAPKEGAPTMDRAPKGVKLRDLLKKHGDFKTLEVHVRKYQKSSFGKTKDGMWARLILNDKFEAQDITGREIGMDGAVQME